MTYPMISDEQKIELVRIIEAYLKENSGRGATNSHIGFLNKEWGIKGFKSAIPGDPVFRERDRYFIYLETLDGKNNHRVNFYLETLGPAIDFL